MTDWKIEFKQLYDSFDKTRLKEAGLTYFPYFEEVVKSQKNPQLAWEMATKSLPTLINWRCSYNQANEENVAGVLTFHQIFLAYLRETLSKRIEVLPQALRDKVRDRVIEFLINLSEMMVREKITSVPLTSYEKNPSGNWRTQFFGDPWNGKNEKGSVFYKMIRDCACDFIQFKDDVWTFTDNDFINQFNTIYMIVVVHISPYVTASGKSLADTYKEYSSSLFNHSQGPMRFQNRKWREEINLTQQSLPPEVK